MNLTALRTLAYVSSATRQLGEEDLLCLAYAAQRFNTSVGVTGLLVFNCGEFAQVIEGSYDAVAEVFARIQKDDLHHEIRVFVDERVHRKLYSDWAMLTSTVDSTNALKAILQFALEKREGDVTTGQIDAARELLNRLL